MLLQVLRAKLHKATVTGAEIEYEGSITIDQALLKEAGILPHEKVLVSDLNNGARLETYVMQAPAGSGTVCLNGAAARLISPGDRVIIMAFAAVTPEEAAGLEARILVLDEQNRVISRIQTP